MPSRRLGARRRGAARRVRPHRRARAIWEVVRALNQHVEQTRAVAARKGRGAGGRARPGPLRPRRRPARRRRRARLVPPGDAPRILAALRQPADLDWERVAYGRAQPAEGIEPAAPLFPRVDAAGRRPRDRHARAPRRVRRTGRRAARDGRARPASTRIVTIGTGIDSCRAALAIAERHDGRLRGARHRPAPGGDARGGPSTSSRELLDAPRGGRGRRDRSRLLPRLRAAATSSARFRGAARLADELGKPVVIHRREADDDTAARPRRSPARSSCTASRRRAARAGARARVLRLVRGQRHVPEGRGAARPPRRRFRPIGSWPRPTARTSRRSRVRGPAERAGERRPHASPRSPTRAGESADELGAQDRRERARSPSRLP